MPNCLADIAFHELMRIDEYNQRREENSHLYEKLLNNKAIKSWLLRYLYLVSNPKELSNYMKSHWVIIGDRYQQVIAPKGTDYTKTLYTDWSCPIAESIASQSINLPNHIQIYTKDIKKIVELIKKFDKRLSTV
jgi:dTDP-4-amino-4,6-dideoxygalactose transaminase